MPLNPESPSPSPSESAYHYNLEVPADGLLRVQVPLPAGSRVTVIVVEKPADSLDDLVAASTTSTDFWDNPEDDEDWNDA
jgi:hypothetical protein